MSGPRIVPLVLPARLRRYRPDASEPPVTLAVWELRLLLGGDMSPGQVLRGYNDLWTPSHGDLQPPAGAILLATPAQHDPAPSVQDVTWLRATFPWLSLVVNVSNPLDAALHGAMATAMAQAGAVALAVDGLSGPGLRNAVRAVPMSKPALLLWLYQALPKWQSPRREEAIEQLIEGLSIAGSPHHDGAGPSRRPLWLQVGRALGAAQVLERAPRGVPLDQIAAESGYHDRQSMQRALRTWFGLRACEIRGTAGCGWLLWRFLSGLGEGPQKLWGDR